MAVEDQQPLGSGFAHRPDGSEVIRDIDLAGVSAVVTGGYSGIGIETVRALASAGVATTVPARNRARAEEALADVEGDVTVASLDLADLASVRAFVDTAGRDLDRLDLLINNAGIMAIPETRIGPGWEAQFGTNHLGHMALTIGLMPLLERAEAPRVVSLSSSGHKGSDIRWDDIHFERSAYDKWDAYGQSKTANALFANALSRRMAPSGGLAFSVHPGGIFTPLQRHLSLEEQVHLGWLEEDGRPTPLAEQGFKTPAQGCATTLWAATSPLLEGMPGVYCEECDVAAPTDPQSPMARFMGVDPHACDDESAERLWELSEAMLADA